MSDTMAVEDGKITSLGGGVAQEGDVTTITTAEPVVEVVPAKPKEEEFPPGTPEWAVREITKERNRRRTAEEASAAAQKQQQALAATLEEAAQKAAKEPDDPEPKQAEFDDPDSFNNARFRWVVRQEAKGLMAQDKKREEENRATIARAQREQTFEARKAVAKAKYEDFDAVALNPALPITPLMAQAIKASEVGPDVAYWLGKHPEEVTRISTLEPLAAAMELGRIESRLTTQVKTVSKAPEPIRPLGGNNLAGEVEDDMDAIAAKQRKAMGLG